MNPIIALEIDRKGRPNWEFEGTTEPNEPVAEDASTDGGGTIGLAEISLGDVRLVNGKINYRDARSGDVIELTDINMAIELPSLDSPLSSNGSVVWNGEKLNLDLSAESPRALVEGGASALEVEVDVDLVSVKFKGDANLSDPFNLSGAVNLDVPSIRKLAAWTGNPIDAPGDGLGPLTIAGDLALKGPKVAFINAEIGIDGMEARGDFRVDTGGAVPNLNGRLDWDELDLNHYLADGGTDDVDSASEEAAGSQGWSDEPIDFSGLKAANAQFSLTTGSIILDQMKIGKSVVKLGLNNGRLTVDLTELALYGGSGTAKLVLNARGKVPLISETVAFKGVQLEPLLTDAAGFDKLSGTANLDLTVKTHGRTERQLVAGLNGTGAISSADGAIRGINLGEMVRNTTSAFLGKAERQQAKTDYAEMKASFTIVNGVVGNRDLSLMGPYAQVTGSGSADMNRRTVQYRVVPKATLATAGTAEAAGVTVPVIVSGSWDDPRFKPDLNALITETVKDPKKVVKGAKRTIKAIKKQGLEGLLQGLGQPPAPAPSGDGADGDGGEPAPVPQNADPRQLLKGLFGG